jgi:hypothetical protein
MTEHVCSWCEGEVAAECDLHDAGELFGGDACGEICMYCVAKEAAERDREVGDGRPVALWVAEEWR